MIKTKLLPYITISLCLISCSPTITQSVQSSLIDGKYDTEFPNRNCSAQLEDISRTVKQIYSVTFYELYEFDYEYKITKSDINGTILQKATKKRDLTTESVIGSGTVIYKMGNRVALLTSAHIIESRDTLYSLYSLDEDESVYVKSMAIKKRQTRFIKEIGSNLNFEILAIDSEKDIAIIGLRVKDQDELKKLKVFNYPIGKSNKLGWGNFVYIMGYPKGIQMLTHGLISKPLNNQKGELIIDAVFNHGFSGGVILAIKDGVPNFELVGIVKESSGERINVITPEVANGKLIYSENLPYEGEFRVKNLENVHYGITRSVSMESIISFYKKNRSLLLSKNYDLSGFFEN